VSRPWNAFETKVVCDNEARNSFPVCRPQLTHQEILSLLIKSQATSKNAIMTATKAAKTWRGHAHAGWLNTNMPCAPDQLTVSATELRITSLRGTFTFTPETIVRIERCGFAPFLWRGIMIRHRVTDYPKCIGFRPRGIGPKQILQELQSYGYNVASDAPLETMP
jgi:hypothetical protein